MTSNQRSTTLPLLRLRFRDFQGHEKTIYTDRAENMSPGADTAHIRVDDGMSYPVKELVEIVPVLVTEALRDAEA